MAENNEIVVGYTTVQVFAIRNLIVAVSEIVDVLILSCIQLFFKLL